MALRTCECGKTSNNGPHSRYCNKCYGWTELPDYKPEPKEREFDGQQVKDEIFAKKEVVAGNGKKGSSHLEARREISD